MIIFYVLKNFLSALSDSGGESGILLEVSKRQEPEGAASILFMHFKKA